MQDLTRLVFVPVAVALATLPGCANVLLSASEERVIRAYFVAVESGDMRRVEPFLSRVACQADPNPYCTAKAAEPSFYVRDFHEAGARKLDVQLANATVVTPSITPDNPEERRFTRSSWLVRDGSFDFKVTLWTERDDDPEIMRVEVSQGGPAANAGSFGSWVSSAISLGLTVAAGLWFWRRARTIGAPPSGKATTVQTLTSLPFVTMEDVPKAPRSGLQLYVGGLILVALASFAAKIIF